MSLALAALDFLQDESRRESLKSRNFTDSVIICSSFSNCGRYFACGDGWGKVTLSTCSSLQQKPLSEKTDETKNLPPQTFLAHLDEPISCMCFVSSKWLITCASELKVWEFDSSLKNVREILTIDPLQCLSSERGPKRRKVNSFSLRINCVTPLGGGSSKVCFSTNFGCVIVLNIETKEIEGELTTEELTRDQTISSLLPHQQSERIFCAFGRGKVGYWENAFSGPFVNTPFHSVRPNDISPKPSFCQDQCLSIDQQGVWLSVGMNTRKGTSSSSRSKKKGIVEQWYIPTLSLSTTSKFEIDIRSIAFQGNRVMALGSDGILYCCSHRGEVTTLMRTSILRPRILTVQSDTEPSPPLISIAGDGMVLCLVSAHPPYSPFIVSLD